MIVSIEPFQNLTQKIDDFVAETGADYIDAVISYCERFNIEPETLGEIISKNPVLKSKIQLEAEALHFIKPADRLPL